MSNTNVQICNLALGMIGAGRIASLDDQSKEARDCNAIFNTLLDEELESFAWTFAAARAKLSQDANPPAFGYAYAYLLPSDCLKPRSLDDDRIKFNIEGRRLLTDASAANLKYTVRVTDPALFTSSFISCLAARMAVNLALSVAKSPELSLKMFNVYNIRKREAMAINADYDVIEAPSSSPYEEARD